MIDTFGFINVHCSEYTLLSRRSNFLRLIINTDVISLFDTFTENQIIGKKILSICL